MSVTVLQVDNLTKQYKNGRGVCGLSINIEQGQVYGLLGPNGSGKSTTMKAITGLLQPDSGDIRIFGRSLQDSAIALDGVGCIIEQPSLYPYMTGRQNMELAARLSGVSGYSGLGSTDAIGHMLQRMGLEEAQHDKVRKYSVGMKQRLGIAMTLLPNPNLLILDEPTGGLDIEGRALVRRILSEEAANGRTILISSHLAGEVELICTHVGVLRNGLLAAAADLPTLMREYGSVERYYLHLIGEEGLAS